MTPVWRNRMMDRVSWSLAVHFFSNQVFSLFHYNHALSLRSQTDWELDVHILNLIYGAYLSELHS